MTDAQKNILVLALDCYIASMVRQNEKLRKQRLEGPAQVYHDLATQAVDLKRLIREGTAPLDLGPPKNGPKEK